MQLQELKKLVEYDAIGTLMASRYGDGWFVCVIKKNDNSGATSDSASLELARGGIRKFKTIDAIKKLVDKELYHHKILIN